MTHRKTANARNVLQCQLEQLLEDKTMRDAVARDKVKSMLKNQNSERLLGTYHFDGIDVFGKTIQMKFDMTPFMRKDPSFIEIRFSRSHGTRNSGMIYSDAHIRAINIYCDEQLLTSRDLENVSLITRYKSEVINPLVDFEYIESNTKIRLDSLILPPDRKAVQLVVDAELFNPGNQWGDRILIYTYLKTNG
jgi:hypothetical protein